jgi:predicted secreted hydrolase
MRGSSARRWLAAIAGAWVAVGAVASPPPTAPEASSGGAPAAGYAQALTVRPFVFPRDHGPHHEFRQEWWYVTGNLDSASGERFGFELTFFRVALEPPPPQPPLPPPAAAAEVGSAWRTREIYLAHFAVTDVARERFRFAHKLSRAALGLAGAQIEPLHVWIDDWSLGAANAGVAGAAGARAAGAGAAGAGETRWRLHAVQPDYEIDLTLEPQSVPVPNGDAGLSRKADEPSDATYYYSIPRVAVRGQLRRDGRTLEVHGLAWLDREWGSGGLGANEAGWDWFGLQLGDGSSLMFYALRNRDGTRNPHSAGTWIAADGAVRALASTDVDIAVTGAWRNSAGERYPARWQVRVPAMALELDVRPVLADQELKTSPRYWEGAVDVSGQRAGKSLGGRGYVELVGYAGARP